MTLPRPTGEPERSHFLRYTHPARWPLLGRYPVPARAVDDLLAHVLGCTPEQVRGQVAAIDESVAAAAFELLRGRGYRADVERLALPAAARVVALGDSLTADGRGWFELLAASLKIVGRTDVTMVNHAVSGDTTSDVIERWDLVDEAGPTHVLVMLGTNDARAHGRCRRHRMVTPEETERNLRVLVSLLSNETGADILLITPPPVDPARARSYFSDSPLGWEPEHIDEVADAIRRVDPDCLDLHAGLRAAVGRGQLVEPDGVHLTASGQGEAVRVLASQLRARLDKHITPGSTETARPLHP